MGLMWRRRFEVRGILWGLVVWRMVMLHKWEVLRVYHLSRNLTVIDIDMLD